jgi:hypothetical protein
MSDTNRQAERSAEHVCPRWYCVIPARSRSLGSQLHDASTPSPNQDLLSPIILAAGSPLSVTIIQGASDEPCHVQRRGNSSREVANSVRDTFEEMKESGESGEELLRAHPTRSVRHTAIESTRSREGILHAKSRRCEGAKEMVRRGWRSCASIGILLRAISVRDTFEESAASAEGAEEGLRSLAARSVRHTAIESTQSRGDAKPRSF